MIRKVSVDQLKPGMYVHDLDCSWMEHPFLHNRFAIDSSKDILRIRQLGLRSIYIDTGKGLDVPDAATATEVKAAVNRQLEHASSIHQGQGKRTSVLEEREYATKVHAEAERIVTEIMLDIKLGQQIHLEKVNPVVERMVDSIFRNEDALLGLTRIRQMDKYTFEHSVSVAVLLVSFAKSMQFDRDTIQEIGTGALLHDIGKTQIPKQILNKPGKLSDAEFQIMRQHVIYSQEILAASKGISPTALAVAAEHHERFDGTGYPAKKAGNGISVYGHMSAIVDVYDALTAHRVYHRGQSPHSVLAKLVEWSGYHFEPNLVKNFVHCVGIYPPGTTVRLASGHIAIVLGAGDKGLLLPFVRLVYDINRSRFITPRDINLSELPADRQDKIIAADAPEKYGIKPEVFMDLGTAAIKVRR